MVVGFGGGWSFYFGCCIVVLIMVVLGLVGG